MQHRPELALLVLANVGHANLGAKVGEHVVLDAVHALLDLLNLYVPRLHVVLDPLLVRRHVLQFVLQFDYLLLGRLDLAGRVLPVRLGVAQSRFQT